MKKYISYLFPILLLVLVMSCENQEKVFPDYKYTSVYFPYQYSVRTLILGDDELTNTENDNKLLFKIGVTLGGLYKNTQNRNVEYVIDETLTDGLYTPEGIKILALPRQYYNLPLSGTIVIPNGAMQGYLDVQLNESFLDDPFADTVKYVIPLKIISAQADTVLRGKSDLLAPDPRIGDNWSLLPKDFTIYGIKYINPYHGTYLYRGKDIYTKGTTIDTMIYTNKFVEKTEIAYLNTYSKNQVNFTTMLRRVGGSPGNLSMILTFDESGNCAITSNANSKAVVTGTGKFVKEGDNWGGKNRNVIHLTYNFTDVANNETHTVADTLVIRDRNVKLETYIPVVKYEKQNYAIKMLRL